MGSVLRRLIVIDVGSHEGQELEILTNQSSLSRLRCSFTLLKKKLGVDHEWNPFALWQEIRELNALRRRIQMADICVALVEPVYHKRLYSNLKYVRSFVFFRGVVSCAPSGPRPLLLAKDDLGNSVFPEKPGLSGESVMVWNFSLADVLYQVFRGFQVDSSDLVILRMNAEGVEREVIDHIIDSRIAIAAVYGSLADVRKCFGHEELKRVEGRLVDAGIRLQWFTSSANSWSPALKTLINALEVAEPRST